VLEVELLPQPRNFLGLRRPTAVALSGLSHNEKRVSRPSGAFQSRRSRVMAR
jgi:hypothetical protein